MNLVPFTPLPLQPPGVCVCGALGWPLLDTEMIDVVGNRIYFCANHQREFLAALEFVPLQDHLDVTRRLAERQAELELARQMLTASQVDFERSERDFSLQRERADAAEANVRLLEEKLREAKTPPEAISREQFLAELATANAKEA